jgi:hypothetical protein
MPSPTGLDAYKIDFMWKNFKVVITDNKTNDNVMEVDCKGMTKPQLKFFKGSKENIIGTASLNSVSIHANCEIRGRAKRIQAMKRWTTEYTYLSDAFADGGLPVAMYWTSSSGKLNTTFSREIFDVPWLTCRQGSNTGTSSFWMPTKSPWPGSAATSGLTSIWVSSSSWANSASWRKKRSASRVAQSTSILCTEPTTSFRFSVPLVPKLVHSMRTIRTFKGRAVPLRRSTTGPKRRGHPLETRRFTESCCCQASDV